MSVLTELWDDLTFIFQYRKKHLSVQKVLDRKAPKARDLAPDFTLYSVSGKEAVTLSDFQGKQPVALVFGSFT